MDTQILIFSYNITGFSCEHRLARLDLMKHQTKCWCFVLLVKYACECNQYISKITQTFILAACKLFILLQLEAFFLNWESTTTNARLERLTEIDCQPIYYLFFIASSAISYCMVFL